MHESAKDLEDLQTLLDRSHDAAGDHLRGVFRYEQRPTAREVSEALDGIFEMHLATTTFDGAPLVAPLDGIFYKGRVWFGLMGNSVRGRLVRRDPRVSASYTDGTFAFIVHGTAVEATDIDPHAAGFETLMRELYVAQYGPGWIEWHDQQQAASDPRDGFAGFIEPRVFFVKR